MTLDLFGQWSGIQYNIDSDIKLLKKKKKKHKLIQNVAILRTTTTE